jgi:hypothetical protein
MTFMNNMVSPISDRLNIGPIVRLAPNIVSVSGIDSIKLLYGTSALDRDETIKGAFGGEFAEGNIGSLPPQESIKMRRLISPPFGRKFLQDQQHIFKDCVNKALNKITRMSKDEGGVVDFYYVAKLYAFEVISSSPFDGAEESDVVACGGCYKADGMEMTMAEYKLASETALGFVSFQFKELSYGEAFETNATHAPCNFAKYTFTSTPMDYILPSIQTGRHKLRSNSKSEELCHCSRELFQSICCFSGEVFQE